MIRKEVTKMVIDENWGVSMQQVCTFFREQPDVEPLETGFRFCNCRIMLTASQSRLGSLVIPRTRLRIEGPQDQVQIIHRRFFLHFLSAGG